MTAEHERTLSAVARIRNSTTLLVFSATLGGSTVSKLRERMAICQ